jgi:hypothetical protein
MIDAEKLALVRDALGLGTSTDACSNMMGAVHDIKRMDLGVDEVCWRTLNRVLEQLRTARAILREAPASKSEVGH